MTSSIQNFSWRLLCLGIALLIQPINNAGAAIQIDSAQVVASVDDGITFDTTGFHGTTIPTTSEPLDLVSGNIFSKNVIDWASNSGQTTLSISMNHQRTGIVSNQFSYTSSNVVFTVNANATYELSGIYSAQDELAGKFGLVGMYSYLVDETTSDVLYEEYFETNNVHNSVLELTGTPTGNLIKDHQYTWSYVAYISSLDDSSGNATAQGRGVLTITDSADPGVVPEATSFLVWGGLAMTAIVGKTSRRRRQE